MAEPFTRDPACAESCCPGQFGTATARAGVTFTARTGLALIDLRGNPQNAAFLASAQAALGCALPLIPNTSATGTDCYILWLGPDAWLLVSGSADKIHERLPIPQGCLTDVSHGRTAWRLTGPHTLDVLAKGCSLDLHPGVFHAGHCAQTSLAHVGALLHLPVAGGGFDLYCARSYAQHVWHWLTEAAAEYGYAVAAPVRA